MFSYGLKVAMCQQQMQRLISDQTGQMPKLSAVYAVANVRCIITEQLISAFPHRIGGNREQSFI